MAISKPNMTRVWAAGAPVGNIEDPDVTSAGKFDDGWLAEIPPFENFNFLQKLFTQSAAYLNEQGIGVYDAITDYPIGGVTKGSDGNLYTALVVNGPATTIKDPVGDTTGKWKPTALLEQLLTSTLTHDMGSDADYTLSVAENYKGRIIITDTGILLTVTRNIIVADTERTIFVKNGTLQDLTFKTSTGTGVTILSGEQGFLLSDGTNVIIPLGPVPLGSIGIPELEIGQWGGEYFKLSDTKATTVEGGASSTTTTHIRTLNTEDNDAGNIVSLASNQFTLQAGTYRILASATGHRTGRQKAFLYNVTDAGNEIVGGIGYADTASTGTRTWISGEFTITAAKVFEIRHFIEIANATGLGLAIGNSTDNEIYTIVEGWKVK